MLQTYDDEIYDEELGKLGLMMDELDGFLSNCHQSERDQIRKMMITCTFSSFDLVNTLKENLDFFKKSKYSNKIRDCISLYCNIPPFMANELLRNSILYKYKYKYTGDMGNIDKLNGK
jgi:hypothetical protein